MRIQTQRETFAYRIAGELPEIPNSVVPMPKNFPGTAQDWTERTIALEKLLHNFAKAGIDSRTWHATKNPITGEYQYSPERLGQHETVMNHFIPHIESVPKGYEGHLMAGLGGAGKTTILKRLGIYTEPPRPGTQDPAMTHFAISADNNKDVMVDNGMVPPVEWLAEKYPDLVPRNRRGELYDFTPMELSSLIQNESRDLANRQADYAYKRGANVVWDYRMGTYESALQHLDAMDKNGYQRKGAVFVDVTPNTSRGRGIQRHVDGMSQFYSRSALSPVDPQYPQRLQQSKRGGRRLPLFATTDLAPKDPTSGELSSSGEAFKRLVTEIPHRLNAGWLHINNEDFNNPIIKNTGGQWAGMTQLPSIGQQRPPMRAARRMFMAELSGTDPHSVLGLLDAYKDGYMDFDNLVEAIVGRYDQIKGQDLHPERAEWSQADRDDMMPDDDNGWWISAAVWSNVLTAEQAKYINDQITSRVIL